MSPITGVEMARIIGNPISRLRYSAHPGTTQIRKGREELDHEIQGGLTQSIVVVLLVVLEQAGDVHLPHPDESSGWWARVHLRPVGDGELADEGSHVAQEVPASRGEAQNVRKGQEAHHSRPVVHGDIMQVVPLLLNCASSIRSDDSRQCALEGCHREVMVVVQVHVIAGTYRGLGPETWALGRGFDVHDGIHTVEE